MRRIYAILLFVALVLVCGSLHARQSRVRLKASRSFMLGVGATRQLDTYLSPIVYSGPGVSLSEEYRKVLNWNDNRGTFRSFVQANVSPGKAWAGSVDCWGGSLRYDATWQYHILAPEMGGLTLKAGGGVSALGGGSYNLHGGNNPAQGYAQMQLLGSVTARYQLPFRKKVQKYNLILWYYADLPLLGGMFSPAYGQSYYEIFERGNYDHNIVLTHPFRDFSLRQQLWIDFCPNTKSPYHLRLGFQSDIRQAQPNHLKQQNISNSMLIGITKYL